MKNYRIFIFHALGWCLFISYELVTATYLLGTLDRVSVYVIYYALNIALFYGQLTMLRISFSGDSSKLFAGMMLWSIMITLYLSIKYVLTGWLVAPAPAARVQFWHWLVVTFYRGSNFLIMGTVYWAASRLSAYRQAADEAERRAEKNRNAYLQQRLNPHLLFNTFSFIYNSVFRVSAAGARAVELLTGILGYTLAPLAGDGKSSLLAEAEQIKHLVEINELRFGKPLDQLLQVSGPLENYRIIPLILLTLTENVFKHGTPGELEISLRVSEKGLLVFHTRNAKPRIKLTAEPHGTGLDTIRMRLDYAYPGNYQLDILDQNDTFELALTVQL